MVRCEKRSQKLYIKKQAGRRQQKTERDKREFVLRGGLKGQKPTTKKLPTSIQLFFTF